jgi:hypothetical protein
MGKPTDNFGLADSFCQPQVALSVNGCWRLAVGGWQLAVGGSRLAALTASAFWQHPIAKRPEPIAVGDFHFRLYFFV